MAPNLDRRRHTVATESYATLWRVLMLMVAGAWLCQPLTAVAQRSDARRAPRPDWSQEDASELFFADAVSEAFRGEWPPLKLDDRDPSAESPSATSVPSGPGFVWSRAVDADLLVNEIKRVTLVLKQATRSKSTWEQYGRDEFCRDVSTLAVLFRALSEWDGEVQFKSDALLISQLLSQAVGNSPRDSASALTAARAALAPLRELIAGNPIRGVSAEPPLDGWSATVDRAWLMTRLERAVESNLDIGLQSPGHMKGRQQELRREANVATVIFGALCHAGCEDTDQSAYVTGCKAAATNSVALRQAIAGGQFHAAREAFSRLRRTCVDCHAEFRF